MVNFTTFFLEYAKKETSRMFGGATDLKSGNNGKLFNAAPTRKHTNTVAKEYEHKNPLVNNIVNGSANNIQLGGKQLKAVLTQYGVDYELGVKTLGNSNVEVEIFKDPRGVVKGILRRKNSNGV